MALFHIMAMDKPDSAALRLATRQAHLDFANALGPKLKLGGPMLSDDGAAMIGSVFVIEADDREELAMILAADPYAKAGLFARVDVRPFRQVFPTPPKAHA